MKHSRQATKLQSYWIIVQSIWVTFLTSVKALFFVAFFKNARSHIDKTSRWWSRHLLRIVQLSYCVFGLDRVAFKADRCYIIMSNHASHYDIPLIYMTFPKTLSIRMMSKKELFLVPLWGAAMRASEFIAIDRKDHKQAKHDLKLAKQKLESGIVLWFAPEGTRTRTGMLGPFKKGGFLLAKQLDAMIIPVGIRRSFDVLPPKTCRFRIGVQAEVHIGKPIDVSKYSAKEIRKLMQDVRECICNLANQQGS